MTDRPRLVVDPVACAACGEERLVDRSDPAVWYCQVCGHSGPAPGLGAATPTIPPVPSAETLHALLLALVQRHLGAGRWQVVAIAPLPQWPRGLQAELTRTLGALPESVVLVLERVPS
jgi:hypothetical protein